MIGADRPSRRVPGAAALGTALVLGLGACSSGELADEAAAAPPSAFLPDDRVAVTDAPRPEAPQAVLSFATWEEETASVEAAGYVTPVIEDGGTCTLLLRRDGDEVSVTVPGMADATTTVCGRLSVPAERLAAGTWSLRLAYVSGTTDVVSGAVDLEVPA